MDLVECTTTTEAHGPSLAKCAGRTKPILFLLPVLSMNTMCCLCCNVKMQDMVPTCIVCFKEALFHCKAGACDYILDDYTYTCGATLSDLELSGSWSEVCVHDLKCYDPLDKLYYSMKYNPICIQCYAENNIVSVQGHYPQCEKCEHKNPKKIVWYMTQVVCACMYM